MLEEAERRCEMQMNVRERLLGDVVNSVKQWQKDSFHKSMMHLKEKKDFEDSFKKVNICISMTPPCHHAVRCRDKDNVPTQYIEIETSEIGK